MKKTLMLIMALVCAVCTALAFGGCGEKLDNSLPMKMATVRVDYSDKTADTILDNDEGSIDIFGSKLFYKDSNNKVTELLAGDRLEIYFTDENYGQIDHIMVIRAKVLELFSSLVPGGPLDKKEVYSKEPDVAVNNTEYGVYWAIDRDGNFIDLIEIDDQTPLYGTYIEDETVVMGNGSYEIKRHYLYALYLYNPLA